MLASRKDITRLLAIAKEQQGVLASGDASSLLALTPDSRRHAMRTLSHLARYNGRYGHWRDMIQQHGLRWRQADDKVDFFEKESITEMIAHIRNIVKILPADQGNTFLLAAVLGLRADEVCKAIALLKSDTPDYHNKQLQILEHYKYKQLFIRRTKKAYISIVDDDMINLAKQSCDCYQAIRSYLKRRRQPMLLMYGRKIFATWLRQNGIESEFVDLLQGRAAMSVFARHYYRPDFGASSGKVLGLLRQLRQTITETDDHI